MKLSTIIEKLKFWRTKSDEPWCVHDCAERGCYIPSQRTGLEKSVTNSQDRGSK